MSAAAASCRSWFMQFEYLLGGVLALALTVYLVYALLVPEKF